jgi:hypothetical protein
MYDIRNLSESDLIDMLSLQTSKLTSLLADLFKDKEYLQCKELINALNQEIEARKGFMNQTVTTTHTLAPRNKF